MKSALKYIVFTLMAFMPLSDLDAKGFSSSRSSFSSSSRSSSSFSSSRPSSPSVSKPSGFSSSSAKPSAVKPSTSTAPKNAFDKSQAARSITPPTPPKPKSEYINEFRTKSASKYPTKFTTPPATRPSYIPQATPSGQPIIYNQAAGGYGFMDGLGQFMLYDAITDIATAAFQKDQTVYVQQVKENSEAIAKEYQNVEKIEKEENNFLNTFVLILIGFITVGALIWLFNL